MPDFTEWVGSSLLAMLAGRDGSGPAPIVPDGSYQLGTIGETGRNRPEAAIQRLRILGVSRYARNLENFAKTKPEEAMHHRFHGILESQIITLQCAER